MSQSKILKSGDPGVEFYVKKNVTYSANTNATYSDLYDNNKTSFHIQSGTVSGIKNNQFVLADFDLPNSPTFGGAEFVGAKLGLYVNTITPGQISTNCGIKAFLMGDNIGNNEGGKSSAGTMVVSEDVLQISAYHDPENDYIAENFGGASGSDENVNETVILDSVLVREEPYLEDYEGWRHGMWHGNSASESSTDRADHRKRYGTLQDNGQYRYYIHPAGDGYHTPGVNSWLSNKISGRIMGRDNEAWSGKAVGHVNGKPNKHGDYLIKFGKTERVERSSIGTDTLQRVTPTNSFFDVVSEAGSFWTTPVDGSPFREAFGDVVYDTSNVLYGGGSCHFNSMYPHRYNCSRHIYYSRARNRKDYHGGGTRAYGSDNQQVSFISKKIPLPVHLGSGHDANDNHPVIPSVEITMNIESLAPMLIRKQTACSSSSNGDAKSLHDYRLNRSIVVTFGDEAPAPGDSLYTYTRRHAQGTIDIAANTGNLYGDNDSGAKSFYGLALVNFDGQIATYPLSATAGQDASPAAYDHVNFVLDQTRGEVCFHGEPYQTDTEVIGTWFDLKFQLHPNQDGCYWIMADSESGENLSTDVPKSTPDFSVTDGAAAAGGGRIYNCRNKDANEYYTNIGAPAPFMTIWCNNYQAVKGAWNATKQKYETGLKIAVDGSGDANIKVYDDSVSDRKEGVYNAGTGKNLPSYLLLGCGDNLWSSQDNSILIKDNDRSLSNDYAVLVQNATSSTIQANDKLFYAEGSAPDTQVQGFVDMHTSFYIDSVKLKHFNMLHDNATPGKNNLIPGKICIPETVGTEPTAWMNPVDGWTSNSNAGTAITNINENLQPQPSYILLGFANRSDFEGAHRYFLMNNFSSPNTDLTTAIFTDNDSDNSNIRVGYTSAEEDWGRQGAADSDIESGATFSDNVSSGMNPGGIGSKSACMDNSDNAATRALRGLISADNAIQLEDTGTGTAEFSIHVDDDGNIDNFTQKGFLQWNFTDDTVGERAVDSGVNTSSTFDNADDPSMEIGNSGASSFTVGEIIQLGTEQMLVTAITDSTPDVLTVTRAYNGTTAGGSQGSGADIYKVAAVEKRECIWASARILEVLDTTTIKVDSPELFRNKDDEEYILYKYDTPRTTLPDTDSQNNVRTLTVTERNGNAISFSKPHGLNTGYQSDAYKYLVGPKRYWLMIEIFNIDAEHNVDAPIGSTSGTATAISDYLPARYYDNGILCSERGTAGASFNEAKYNDGAYLNRWNLEPFAQSESSVVIHSDFGFGDFDEEDTTGGHAGFLPLNVNLDTGKYHNIDVSGVVGNSETDARPGGTLTCALTIDKPDSAFKINVDSEDGTNPLYTLGVFEDKKPNITNFQVKPNEINPQHLDFTWDCDDDDLWYGLLFVDTKQISNQYSNAIAHIPLNEDSTTTYLYYPDRGELFNQSSDASNRVTGTVTATTTADIGGLAGYTKVFDSTDAGISYAVSSTDTVDGAVSSGVKVVMDNAVAGKMTVGDRITGNTALDAASITVLALNPDGDNANEFSMSSAVALADGLTLTFSRMADPTKEMTLVAHCVPNYSEPSAAASRNIFYRSGWAVVTLETAIDGSSYVKAVITDALGESYTLNSNFVYIDGKIPLSIIVVVDMNIKKNHIKLFIDGEMADSVDMQLGTAHDNTLAQSNNTLYIGNDDNNDDDAFNGSIEEVVIYNKALQVVNSKAGSFTFTKPLQELNTNQSGDRPQNYTARLFIKDYHNIRGTTAQEVGSSSQIAFNRANLTLSGV